MKIVFCDEHIIVCIKPAGVISTDEPGGMPELIRKTIGNLDAEIKAVHRLDAVVAGLMVYAFSQKAASALSTQITEKTFHKEYLAITEGCPKEDSGRMDDYLWRNPSERKTYVVSKQGKEVRDAALEYTVCEKREGLSLVRINLLTGRTHQIRAQFSSRSLPLYGDSKYGSIHKEARIALWSFHLEFQHPVNSQTMSFYAYPPDIEPWTRFHGYYEHYASCDVCSDERKDFSSGECVYANICGGCSYQGKTYAEQLLKKQKSIKKYLGEYSEILPIIGAEQPMNYRNKAFYVFDTDKMGKPVFGMYREASSKLIYIDKCVINSPLADRIARKICLLMGKFQIQSYNQKKKTGWLRNALIRISACSHKVMLVLGISTNPFKSKDAFLRELVQSYPEIITIILETPDAVREVIYGEGYIEDELCNYRFRVFPKSNYHANSTQAEKLYKLALEFAALTGEERVLDIDGYSFVLGILASSLAKSVLCIGQKQDVIKDTLADIKRYKANNIQLRCENMNDGFVFSQNKREGFDIIFLNSPRFGRKPTLIESVCRLKAKKIIYLSSDTETLARDLKMFSSKNYRIEAIRSVDILPYTPQIETVVLLIKETKSSRMHH